MFLGTEKYPKENDFETFLGQNGGVANAYTDMEDTNYYFSVAPALDHEEEEDYVDSNQDQEEVEYEESYPWGNDEMLLDTTSDSEQSYLTKRYHRLCRVVWIDFLHSFS